MLVNPSTSRIDHDNLWREVLETLLQDLRDNGLTVDTDTSGNEFHAGFELTLRTSSGIAQFSVNYSDNKYVSVKGDMQTSPIPFVDILKNIGATLEASYGIWAHIS